MNKSTIVVTTVLIAVFGVCSPVDEARAGGYWNCDTKPVVDLLESALTGSEPSGQGTVCVTWSGLSSKIWVRGLTEGFAYTVWWVYIDDKELCAGPIAPFEPPGYAGPCGFGDFFDFVNEPANPLAVFGRMDSAIPGHKGWTRFSGDLRGMKPSPGSQVWLLIFGHGPADMDDGQRLARQLLTPEDPGAGAPHLGIDGTMNSWPSSVVVIDIP
jgi:hypothetical protein